MTTVGVFTTIYGRRVMGCRVTRVDGSVRYWSMSAGMWVLPAMVTSFDPALPVR
jgi:hypothetical protein